MKQTAQRAHANFTENLTPTLTALLVAGLKYPVYAGGLGAAWSVGRALYALGYVNNGPQGRGAYVSRQVSLALRLSSSAAFWLLSFCYPPRLD